MSAKEHVTKHRDIQIRKHKARSKNREALMDNNNNKYRVQK
jgi:hypothetical protein